MKSFSFASILALSLALVGCGWNPFYKMYSAMAVIEVMPPDVINIAYMKAGIEQWNRIPTDMLSPIFLTPIINEQKLDQIWTKRFKPGQNALSQQEALDHLRKVLKIEWVAGTDHIKITASSEVPQEAADIANAVADNYKAFRDQEDEARNKRGLDMLRDQITQQQRVVDDARAALVKTPQGADARSDLDEQQGALDSMNVHLKQLIYELPLAESPVRILSRAVPPTE